MLQPGGVVHVLGGPQAIATSIDDTLLKDGFDVRRLAGGNRYQTAVVIAEHIGDGPTFLVDGTDFADALAAPGGPRNTTLERCSEAARVRCRQH